MAQLGLYYAAKIQAAVKLLLWRRNRVETDRQQAVQYAQDAYTHWTAYSSSMARRYRPQRLSRMRNMISPDMFDDCARLDIFIAQGENTESPA